MSRREVAVVTTGRSDHGLLVPVMRALRRRGVRARWLVTGAHLVGRLGATLADVKREEGGDRIDRVPMLVDGDTPEAIAKSIGIGVAGAAHLFARRRPDLLVVLGDRFETLAMAVAATSFNIPIAHVHGGELTEGAIDDVIRHAITKMSHLHFVSTREYGRRVRQMGEDPRRVFISGAPGLDGLTRQGAPSARDLARTLRVPVGRRTLLVTYHPETRHPAHTLSDLDALLAALDRVAAPTVFTTPNADAFRDRIEARIRKFVAARPERVLASNLGRDAYIGLMRHVGAMVGNSSSGLIEAPSCRLPVVNVGGRQAGRIRARNVISVTASSAAVERAVRRALSPTFRASLRGLRNPYGDGRAGDRIARVIATVPLDEKLLIKRFVDLR